VNFLSSSGKGAWIRVVMGEGKKRQIREVGRLLGLPVVKIIRLRIGTLKLGSLKPRQWRYLTENEVMELKGEKVPTMDRRIERARTNRSDRNPRDRITPTDGAKRNPKDRPKRAPSDRPRTTGRTENNRSDRNRSNTKTRTPRR
jgi:23S rRNA pseudouridine2605 synthase